MPQKGVSVIASLCVAAAVGLTRKTGAVGDT
jgi:hypothetical protein